MTIKPIRWVRSARKELQDLPEDARKGAGFALWTIQQGESTLSQSRAW
jgi:phage-related protein